MSSEGVFLVRDGQLIEMGASPYNAEADLQALLARYPALLPGRQIDPNDPRKWLLIAREQGVPAREGGPDQWSADHLFVDQDGTPTIVEVKRSTNSQIRREVVGQMLDYAANGVRFWPVERLRDDLARRLGGRAEADDALRGFLKDAGAADLEPDAFWRRVDANLRAGRLRMLFVADEIPDSLKQIIEFLNEQLTQCEVLGVEIRQYVAEGHQVLAPTVIGQTSEARRVKGYAESRTFDELLAQSSDAVREIESRFSALAQEKGWTVTTSRTGRHYRLPDGNVSLIELYPQDLGGGLQFTTGGIRDAGLVKEADSLKSQLEAMVGKTVGPKRPWVAIEPILANWATFTERWLRRYVAAVTAALEYARRVAEETG